VANNVVIPLHRIETFKPGEARKYAEPDLGFSLTLPPDWYAYRSKGAEQKPSNNVFLLEPDGEFDAAVKAFKLDELSAEEKKSPRAWAEKWLVEAAKREKDLQVRADSWQPMSISGREAISFAADFTAADGRKMARFVVCVIGQDHAARLAIDGPRDDLERMKEMILPVVEGLEVQ
jgi:hypothetical protein